MTKRIVSIKHEMSLMFTLFCPLVICHVYGQPQEHRVNATEDAGRVDEDASGSNSSYYSTREMRDMCLKEWGGKTQEVQEYFDQLPQEMFKEDSDTLKFMHYYEKKGMKNVDTNQVYNITPLIRDTLGPEYTIEVNDSHVPKYRITESEEMRMDKYGTFNSKEDRSSGETLQNTEDTSEVIVTTEPPGSEEKTPEGGKKKKRRPKKWPSNMDPKGRVKRKKKKESPSTADKTKKKEMIEKEINIPKRLNLEVYEGRKYNGQFEEVYKRHVDRAMDMRYTKDSKFKKTTIDKTFRGVAGVKLNPNRQKHLSIFDSFMTSCKLKHKHKDHNHHHRNFSQPRRRSQQKSIFNIHQNPFL